MNPAHLLPRTPRPVQTYIVDGSVWALVDNSALVRAAYLYAVTWPHEPRSIIVMDRAPSQEQVEALIRTARQSKGFALNYGYGSVDLPDAEIWVPDRGGADVFLDMRWSRLLAQHCTDVNIIVGRPAMVRGWFGEDLLFLGATLASVPASGWLNPPAENPSVVAPVRAAMPEPPQADLAPMALIGNVYFEAARPELTLVWGEVDADGCWTFRHDLGRIPWPFDGDAATLVEIEAEGFTVVEV